MSRVILSLFVLLALLPPVALQAAAGNDQDRVEAYAAICEQAALQAAAESGVPPDILTALTLTETGRRMNGRLRPWAWSVNAEGAGNWHDDPQSLLRFAEERVRQGRPNMDLGCFQINYRWHGDQFAGLPDMLNPLSNARYAARFVRELYQETGDWRAAAGAFHSKTPQYASKYLARFDQVRTAVIAQGLPSADEAGRVRLAALNAGTGREAGAGSAPPQRTRGLRRSDMGRGIAARAGTGSTGVEPSGGGEAQGTRGRRARGHRVAALDPTIAALDRFVAQQSGGAEDAVDPARLAAWAGSAGSDATFMDGSGAEAWVTDAPTATAGWTGQTPSDLPTGDLADGDLLAGGLAAVDLVPGDLPGDLDLLLAASLDPTATYPDVSPDHGGPPPMLLGAPQGSEAQGGGSLAALNPAHTSLLNAASAPILGAAAQPLPGLPSARTGPPASGSSLWQIAAAME